MISKRHKIFKSCRSMMSVIHIYEIMKNMYPLGYHHNDFVRIHANGHIMSGLYTYTYPFLSIFQMI